MEKSKAQTDSSSLATLLSKNEAQVLEHWTSSLLANRSSRRVNIREADLNRQARDFLSAVRAALERGGGGDIQSPSWEETRGILADISRHQASQGANPSEIAIFILSLKEALFDLLQTEFANDPQRIAREIWNASRILDDLGLLTTDIALKSREETIIRQQKEMLELSTPVWDPLESTCRHASLSIL